MGDSLINALIHLVPGKKKNHQKLFSSDTTFREVYDWILCLTNEEHKKRNLTSSNHNRAFTLFDCTVHPIKRLELLSGINDGLSGEQSVTLHSLGWFPSAKVVVFYADDLNSQNQLLKHIGVLHDADLWLSNWDDGILDSKQNPVKLLSKEWNDASSSKPTPSQLLDSITHRHEEENTEFLKTRSKCLANGTKDVLNTKRIEMASKLDERIRSLEEMSKTSHVSAQVRRMLIKSRSNGDNSLREDDRFYMEFYSIDDTCESNRNNLSKQSPLFYFFSRLALVGNVLDSFAKPQSNQSLELLIQVDKKSTKDSKFYRRLPNTIALYEAEKYGLMPFHCVFVRKYFTNDRSSATAPIISIEEESTISEENMNKESNIFSPLHSKQERNESSLIVQQSTEEVDLRDYIDKLIASCDIPLKDKKNGTSVRSEKVRHMLMKGKAKGDKTTKLGDRFYLEVCIIDESNESDIKAGISLQFFDNKASFGRICLSSFSNDLGRNTEVLIKKENLYFRFPETMKLSTAESTGLVRQFDRVVVRKYTQGNGDLGSRLF